MILISTFVSLFLVGAFVDPGSIVEKAAAPTTNAASTRWFQSTEQSLMDAIATGDKKVWEQVLDESFISTSEEGQTLSKEDLLKEFTGLPPGLTGSIKVEDLTVQEFPTFAIVRFLADETEDVFGQQLKTKYRVTDTFRKAGSEWKLIASHLSVVTADPPPQNVSKESWPDLVGDYKLLPQGWVFHVVMRDGDLLGGRNPEKLRPLIPLAPNVFVRKGALGELIFVTDKDGNASKILEFRKFQPLIWTRIDDQ